MVNRRKISIDVKRVRGAINALPFNRRKTAIEAIRCAADHAYSIYSPGSTRGGHLYSVQRLGFIIGYIARPDKFVVYFLSQDSEPLPPREGFFVAENPARLIAMPHASGGATALLDRFGRIHPSGMHRRVVMHVSTSYIVEIDLKFITQGLSTLGDAERARMLAAVWHACNRVYSEFCRVESGWSYASLERHGDFVVAFRANQDGFVVRRINSVPRCGPQPTQPWLSP